MNDFLKQKRNTVKRAPKRGSYDKDTIYQIIDESLLCHVGFVVDGQPFVIPTVHARLGDDLIFHGAKASRLLKHLQAGHPVSISMALLDGLVLARSAFNHSMNFRSVVLFGSGRPIDDDAEKNEALRGLTEQVVPGRWAEVREPNQKELNATAVAAVAIESASAKMRSGPPIDESSDYDLPIWAGLLPLRQQALEAEPDPKLTHSLPVPDSVKKWRS